MRVRVQLLHVVALAGMTLFPISSEASLITNDTLATDLGVSNSGHSEADSIDHAWSNSGLPSLVDETGDPLLLLSSFDSYGQFGGHGKLRGQGANNFFVPFGGGFGGGSGGGSGFPGPQTFSIQLPSFGPGGNPGPGWPPGPGWNPGPGGNSNPELNLNLNVDLPLDPCLQTSCSGGPAGQTVPEPSLLILVAPALAMAVRRARRKRAPEPR
jgi:hypothetical protein